MSGGTRRFRNEPLRLPNGEVVYKVSKDDYLFYEQVRNYILRNSYERKTPMWLLRFKAMSLFDITQRQVNTALKTWLKWYYDAGIRHRPIELFIQDNKVELSREMLTIKNLET